MFTRENLFRLTIHLGQVKANPSVHMYEISAYYQMIFLARKSLWVDDGIHNWLVLSQLMAEAHEWCRVSTFSGNLASFQTGWRSSWGMPDSQWSCPRDPVNVKVNMKFSCESQWWWVTVSIIDWCWVNWWLGPMNVADSLLLSGNSRIKFKQSLIAIYNLCNNSLWHKQKSCNNSLLHKTCLALFKIGSSQNYVELIVFTYWHCIFSFWISIKKLKKKEGGWFNKLLLYKMGFVQ